MKEDGGGPLPQKFVFTPPLPSSLCRSGVVLGGRTCGAGFVSPNHGGGEPAPLGEGQGRGFFCLPSSPQAAAGRYSRAWATAAGGVGGITSDGRFREGAHIIKSSDCRRPTQRGISGRTFGAPSQRSASLRLLASAPLWSSPAVAAWLCLCPNLWRFAMTPRA